MKDDARWMAAAIALSTRGRGRTGSNPNVGCIVVSGQQVAGRGYTGVGGRPHAEAIALTQAGPMARGATLYATLEPCAHHSERGPACSDLIVGAGIARVVVAVRDPDPRTDGAGLARLRAAGIDVVESVETASARRAMAGWLTRQRFGRPHVTLKLAMSIDGCIALGDGESRWITGPRARAHGHLERSRAEMILVGRGTLDKDAPRLDVRLAGLESQSPARYVLSSGSHGTDAVPEAWETIHCPQAIAALRADTLLVEGGAGAASAFLAADLVDRLLIYRAPILVGDGRGALQGIDLRALAAAHGRWHQVDSRMLGVDSLDIYERVRDEA